MDFHIVYPLESILYEKDSKTYAAFVKPEMPKQKKFIDFAGARLYEREPPA